MIHATHPYSLLRNLKLSSACCPCGAVIKKDTGIDVELVEGRRGEFTVWVGDAVVAQKDDEMGFPSEEDVLAAVQRALAAGP